MPPMVTNFNTLVMEMAESTKMMAPLQEQFKRKFEPSLTNDLRSFEEYFLTHIKDIEPEFDANGAVTGFVTNGLDFRTISEAGQNELTQIRGMFHKVIN